MRPKIAESLSMEKPAHRPYSKRILGILGGATLLIIIAHLVLQYLNLEVFYQQQGQIYELSNRFDLDDESSVPTWFSQFTMLGISVLALLTAYFQSDRGKQRLWGLIATIGLIMSIDEVATLHEYFLQTLHVLFFKDASSGLLANAWVVVAPFVLLIAGLIAWKMYIYLPKRTLLLFITAGVTFMTGAVVIDLITSVSPREMFLNQGIYVAIEESFELFANVLVIYTIADYLETNYYDAISGSLKKLKASKN